MRNKKAKDESALTSNEADHLSGYILHKQWTKLKEWIDDIQTNSSAERKRMVLQTVSSKEQHLNGHHLNPFHWALFAQVDNELLLKMIDIGGKGMLETVDADYESHSLIWAATNRIGLEVMQKIILVGGDALIQATNRRGNNALHMACRFDQDYEIIHFLVEKGGMEALTARNEFGELPVHLACQCHFDTRVIELLIKRSCLDLRNSSLRDLVDKNGFSPIDHAFNSSGSKEVINYLLELFHDDKGDKMIHKNAVAMLSWIQEQREEDKHEFLRKPFVRRVLNKYSINPLYLSILMVDVYMQLVLVGIFSFGIHAKDIKLSEPLDSKIFFLLNVAVAWRTIREVLQWYSRPLKDRLSNWPGFVSLILLVGSSAFLSVDRPLYSYEGSWICITTGVVWLNLIVVISNLRFEISVFVAAIRKIVVQLIPFLLTTGTIILAFGNMFYIARLVEDRECISPDDESGLLEGWFCTVQDSYFTTFTMFLSTDWVYFNRPAISLSIVLAYLFALVTGILLMNILIAEISNVYTDMREKGRLAFWSNRLSCVVEISHSFSGILRLEAKNLTKRPKDEKTLAQGRIIFSNISTWIYRELDKTTEEEKIFFLWFLRAKDVEKPNFISRMRVFLRRASIEDILFPGKAFERVVSDNTLFSRVLLSISYPIIPFLLTIQFLLGCVSFGLLWPYWMKKMMFAAPIAEPNQINENVIIAQYSTRVEELEKKVDSMENKLDRILNAVERRAPDEYSV
jgi:ankyrin repeat protein